MWKYLIICLLLGMVSCKGANTSDKTGKDSEKVQEITVANIQGQWDIENIVENDSSYVRPSEVEQGVAAYIDFIEDNTFGIMTNCNHIGGRYGQDKDSLHLSEISTTEMACDNMEVEEMLKKVLPLVNSIDCINDSITRLNSEKGDTYIVLKKRDRSVK